MPRRALLSVSEKSGLPDFARALADLGFELYSTGGTLTALAEEGVEVRPVSDLTGFPEIMDGRVKTLHPGVHGGLLARRDKPEHLAALAEHGLKTIDLLCVNLYPFVATATREGVSFEEVIENIDIGGPAMIRAAAKNYEAVLVVVRPERYADVLAALGTKSVPSELRRELAAEAYAHTAYYDAAVAGWLSEDLFPPELPVAGRLVQKLRYGENPHQEAGFYRLPSAIGGLGSAKQLQGGELSYNNIQDAAAAFALASEFQHPAAAIIKHTNPCGCAISADIADAYRRAYECDTVSAYGGVVAVNRPLDRETAEQIAAIFVEVVIAPGFRPEALEVMGRKAKVRLLEVAPVHVLWGDLEFRSVPGGFLAQTPDRGRLDPEVARGGQQAEADRRRMGGARLRLEGRQARQVERDRPRPRQRRGRRRCRPDEPGRSGRPGGRARRRPCQGLGHGLGRVLPLPGRGRGGDRRRHNRDRAAGRLDPRQGRPIAAADKAKVAMVFTGVRHFRH